MTCIKTSESHLWHLVVKNLGDVDAAFDEWKHDGWESSVILSKDRNFLPEGTLEESIKAANIAHYKKWYQQKESEAIWWRDRHNRQDKYEHWLKEKLGNYECC